MVNFDFFRKGEELKKPIVLKQQHNAVLHKQMYFD